MSSILAQADAGLAAYDCRNNRLTQMGLETDGFADRVREAIARYGRTRVGIFLGTSTAGILQTELAYRRRDAESRAAPPYSAIRSAPEPRPSGRRESQLRSVWRPTRAPLRSPPRRRSRTGRPGASG